MVRLAAIRAAGELKATDCLDQLFELMQSVPDDESHFAARAGLRAIATVPAATEAVIALAAKNVNDLAEKTKELARDAPAEGAEGIDYDRQALRRKSYPSDGGPILSPWLRPAVSA